MINITFLPKSICKGSSFHPYGTSSWCALTRNFGRASAPEKLLPKMSMFHLKTTPHTRPKKKLLQSKYKQILCLFSILVFSWIFFFDSTWCIVSHDRLRQLRGDSQGQDLLESCWLLIWKSVGPSVENLDH